jgi:single-strand DNA-binding protein
MLNRIIIMGRLTAAPELKTTQSGVSVVSFTVACERDYSGQGQEKQTDFVDCTAWRGTAEFVSKHFRKGSMIVVSGRLQSRKWEDRDGNKRTSWEILAESVYFGESRRDEAQQGGSREAGRPVSVTPPEFREMPGAGSDNPFVGRERQASLDDYQDDDGLPF